MASVVLGIRKILHPINGWQTMNPGAFSGLEFVGTNGSDNWKTESPFYPKITPAAQKIVDSAELQEGGAGFTWADGLVEYYGPKYQDAWHKEYRLRPAVGPGVSDLRYGNLVLPNAAPQSPFGHPSGNQKPGIDMPLARGMAGGFFSAAIRPGGSISTHFQSALSIEVNLPSFADIRREFANQFAGPLRAFFDTTPPGPPSPPPVAPPGTEQITIYVAGEDVAASPAPTGNNETYIPGSGYKKPAGGSSEPFLESIDSSLKGISHQLSAIASAINRLKEPNTTEDEQKDAEKGDFLDLLKTGANILGSLFGLGTGVGDAAIGGAADAAKAIGGAALDELIDELGDLVDALIKGPEDEAVDGRFDKMADLFQYNGKSFTEYLYLINEALRSPQSSGSLDKEGLTEVLDKYLLASTAGGVEGNITDYVGVPYWTQEVPE